MVDQKYLATLAPFGEPKKAFEMLDLQDIFQIVSEKEKKRIESAINKKYCCYPRSKNLYMVKPFYENDKETVYNINLNKINSCSCEDYIYRPSDNYFPCKHVWIVLLLIKLNALPAKNVPPYNWLIKELNKDLKYLKDQNVNTKSAEENIRKLILRLTNTNYREINYEFFFRKRGQIMDLDNLTSI